jgi:uncharacterized protein
MELRIELSTRYLTAELVNTILKEYELPLFGTHGISHWARVLENGRILTKGTGANLKVVELFAIFHDSRRKNEGWDIGHGSRGAKLAASLRGSAFEISDEGFRLLETACVQHTDGLLEADITVQTCWDSDRLDLLRAGIRPDPKMLCTAAAKDSNLISWANERSMTRFEPSLILEEWGIDPRAKA